MDLMFAYQNGYSEAKSKVLSNDEKAFMEGFNTAVNTFKTAFINADEIVDEKPTMAQMEMEIIKQFCDYVDSYIACDWLECLISFMDERLAEQNKTCEDADSVVVVPNKEYKWNKENYDIDEPEDIVEEDNEEDTEE